MMQGRLVQGAAALLASSLLVACAAMLPKLEPPQLTVTRVTIGGGSLQQQQLHLTLHVVNPNARAIAVHGIDCNLELDGQTFASGATDEAFTVPASGETDFGLNVSANLANAFSALLGGLGHNTVDYRIYGVVHLSGGLVRNIPFDQKGRVRL
jgi:LEA14-like dessication related protein